MSTLGGITVINHTEFTVAAGNGTEVRFPAATLRLSGQQAAMFVDEGKLNWDDPVRKHLPDFHLAEPAGHFREGGVRLGDPDALLVRAAADDAGKAAPGWARTAAALLALYSAGVTRGQEVERGLAYLLKNRPDPKGHQALWIEYLRLLNQRPDAKTNRAS